MTNRSGLSDLEGIVLRVIVNIWKIYNVFEAHIEILRSGVEVIQENFFLGLFFNLR